MQQYMLSIKAYAAALVMQIICNVATVLGMISIAEVTAFFTMLATGFAMLNGAVLLVKNLRKRRERVGGEDTNNGEVDADKE